MKSKEKTIIFYFSGTGNSLKVAKDLSKLIPNSELVPIKTAINDLDKFKAEKIGFIFPVYSWGPPKIVSKFVSMLNNDAYYFAITTCGGSACGTLTIIDNIIKNNKQKLSSGFIVQMPGNYIPMYGAKSEETQKKLFSKQTDRMNYISNIINNKEIKKIEKGGLISNILLTGIVYPFFIKGTKHAYKNFWITDKCNGCGICVKICPVDNIKLKNKKPVWDINCEQCLSCIQWCPKEAIQYKKGTITRKRYHHPKIDISEIIKK